MAVCDVLDLCIEVTDDPDDHNTILIRETEFPEVVVKTSRKELGSVRGRRKERQLRQRVSGRPANDALESLAGQLNQHRPRPSPTRHSLSTMRKQEGSP